MLARAGSLFCVAIAAALAIAGCTRARGRPTEQSAGQAANQSDEPSGRLTGQIVRGPTSPVSDSRITAPPSPAVAGAEIRILDFKGALAATVGTDSSGHYRVPLPPGNYRVERGAGFSGAARNLPATVAISPGGETRLDIWVDTGIRGPGGPAAIR
jgi:hypothetical protein